MGRCRPQGTAVGCRFLLRHALLPATTGLPGRFCKPHPHAAATTKSHQAAHERQQRAVEGERKERGAKEQDGAQRAEQAVGALAELVAPVAEVEAAKAAATAAACDKGVAGEVPELFSTHAVQAWSGCIAAMTVRDVVAS